MFSMFEMDREAIRNSLYDLELSYHDVDRIVTLGRDLERETNKKLDEVERRIYAHSTDSA